MRGRVDRSAGFEVRPSTPPLLTNLIQKFEIGNALSRMFQIKERTPSPTLGMEVMPVVLVDDMLKGAYPPRRRVTYSQTVGPGAPGLNSRVHTINCRGSTTDPERAKFDKLVVHEIMILHAFGGTTQWELHVGNTSGITGLASLFAQLDDTTFDQPAVGEKESDFTSGSQGESPDVFADVGNLFLVPPNVMYRINGPFIIGQGECIALRAPATAAGSAVMFRAEEWPAL